MEGDVFVGTERTPLTAGQVGWLLDIACDLPRVTNLRVTAGESGARLVLYAGERQGVPIMVRGPFVAENRADLMRLSKQYTEGNMPRISELATGLAASSR